MFNYSKLRGRLAEKGITHKSFASAIGITPVAFSNKIRSGRGFKPELIVTACKILDISDEEIAPYFFCPKV